MKILYLINQYPKVSHTFIRREILSLEELVHTVERVAMRSGDPLEMLIYTAMAYIDQTKLNYFYL
jgi:colanic acid/amylovoran biosynthesis glycosyltransferase